MPQCSDLGEGYTGEWPACTYSPPGAFYNIDLTRLPEHPSGEDWSIYFDPYDPTKQEMAERDAVTDIGQLQDIWSLQSGQLGEAYGLKTGQLEEAWGLQKGQLGENWQQRKGSLGAEAGLGYRKAFGLGETAEQKSNMAFSGGAKEMQRMGMQDVQGAYQRAFGLGQTAYEQAMESGQMGYQQALETAGLGYEQALATGELGLTQGTTDIYQQLGQDIYGYVEDWQDYQRDTRNMLYSSGLDWGDDGTDGTTEAIGGTTGGNIPYGAARGYQEWSKTWNGTTQPPSNFGQYYPTIGTWTWNGTEYVQDV